MSRAVTILLAVALAGPARGEAQSAPGLHVEASVHPETVTVGDRFRSVLRVRVPPGRRLLFDELSPTDSVWAVEPVQVMERAGSVTAVYTLAAWVAGGRMESRVTARLASPDEGGTTYVVPLRMPVVRSVLPADTAEQVPRPVRSILPLSGRRGIPWLWVALALLALAAVAWVHARRRTGRPQPTARDARRRALAELDGLERSGLVAPSGAAKLYPAVTRILRLYLQESEPGWSTDLTTTELLERMRATVPDAEVSPLRELLEHADRVKFAGDQPGAAQVQRFWSAARAWVLASLRDGEER